MPRNILANQLTTNCHSVGTRREKCGELCTHEGSAPARGEGKVERVFSTGMIRGDGREAKEPTFDPVKRANRPGGGCDDC